MEKLYIEKCGEITDQGLSRIAECCSNLSHINSRGNHGLTDITLMSIVEGIGRVIQDLAISGCKLITDEGVLLIAEMCPLLKFLYLNCCIKITDNAVVRIAEMCPHIAILCHAHCSNIKNTSMRKIAECSSHLQILSISHCSHITADVTTRLCII